MPTITVYSYYVSPDPCDAGTSPNVNIKWEAADTSINFMISGLSSAQFQPTGRSQCNNTPFTTADTNSDNNQYNYTVTICTYDGEVVRSFDPSIKNGTT